VKATLLLTSAGRRVELLHCFRDDARRLGCDLTVLTTDLHPELSPACHESDLALPVPRCTADDYPAALLEIVRQHGVTLVVPTIDTELLGLARLAPQLEALGARVAISSPEVIALARDKWATEQALRTAGIPTPRTAPLTDLLADPGAWRWPVIVKPADGSNSQGLHRLATPSELGKLPANPTGLLAQECIRGAEFTVNVFLDRAGRIRCAIPHERLEVRGGEVSKALTRRLPQLPGLVTALESVLRGGYGPLCFQGILDAQGDLVVFEINARFGGGFPVAHRAGARFSQWLLEDALGLPNQAHDHWASDVTMLRYDAAVFLGGEGSP
jgi:carbamoyl-phosphate synthase large subunit